MMRRVCRVRRLWFFLVCASSLCTVVVLLYTSGVYDIDDRSKVLQRLPERLVATTAASPPSSRPLQLLQIGVKTLEANQQQVPVHHMADHSTDLSLPVKVEIFPAWTTESPQDKTPTHRVYLYSAIVALHNVPPNGTEIQLVAFQDGRIFLNLTCCLMHSDSGEIYAGQRATLGFSPRKLRKTPSKDLKNVGLVYRCWFPFTNERLGKSHVTLTSSPVCPSDVGRYVNVHHPEQIPDGLAVCAKVAFGLNLDPTKLVEWFEMQRVLGVDRIQLFDLGNTDMVYRVFKHYQDMGLLDLLPYKLPGRPWGRFILRHNRDWQRYGDDKELIIWDCRLRLAGHRYVMGVDLDEVILPQHHMALKPFLQEQFALYPSASSLHFKTFYFLDNWGPVDPESPVLMLRYLNSTTARTETSKHVYLPPRTLQAFTHNTLPYRGYRRVKFINPSKAAVYHYRSCKHNWKFSCEGPRRPDHSMLRFQDRLVPAVAAVRQKFGLQLP